MRHTKESDLQDLERLCLRYPEKAMSLLALRGRKKFLALYKEVSGIDLDKPRNWMVSIWPSWSNSLDL